MGAGMGKALIPALIAAAIPAAGALGGVAASAAQSLLLIPAAAGAGGLAIGTLTLATQGVRRCARRRGRSVSSGFRHELAEQAGKEPRPPTMSAGGAKGSDSVTWLAGMTEGVSGREASAPPSMRLAWSPGRLPVSVLGGLDQLAVVARDVADAQPLGRDGVRGPGRGRT